MISRLSVDEIIRFLQSKPEQAAFDWKVDFVQPVDDEKRGELLKDIAAIANASPLSYGFILFRGKSSTAESACRDLKWL